MPIVGLTDRGANFPEIGNIRKGDWIDDDKGGHFVDLDYFRVEFNDEKAIARFAELYPDKPTEIKFVLPFNNINRVWDAWKEAYTGGRDARRKGGQLIARSDGEYMAYWMNVQNGELMVLNGVDKNGNKVANPPGDVVGSYVSQFGKKAGQRIEVKLENYGRLKIVIWELARTAYVTVHTGSTWDILNISQQLEAVKKINHGVIAGVPLILRRRNKWVNTPVGRQLKSLISVEAAPEWVEKKLTRMSHESLQAAPEIRLLTGEEDAVDGMFEEVDFDNRPTPDHSSQSSERFASQVGGESVPRPDGNDSMPVEVIEAGKWRRKLDGKTYSELNIAELKWIVGEIEAYFFDHGEEKASKELHKRLDACQVLIAWKIERGEL